MFRVMLAADNSDEIELEAAETREIASELIEEAKAAELVDEMMVEVEFATFALDAETIDELISDLMDEIKL